MEYNPEITKVCPYPYYWLVKFKDGGELAQYTETGGEVLYQEVLNRLQAGRGLSSVSWMPTHGDKPFYTQHIDSSWQRPIVLRRHFDTVHTRSGTVSKGLLLLLGWQATIAGRNYKSILFIDPETGSVEAQSDL